MLTRLVFVIIFLSSFLVNAYVIQNRTPKKLISLDVTNGLNKNGSNVCSYMETISKQVNVSYLSQRWYTEYFETCNWWGKCTNISRLATRNVVSHRLVTRYFDRDVYYCCNGWTRKDDTQPSCNIPICSIGCQNGGKCIGPNQCSCPSGFSGKFCQIDNNECADPSVNKCEQVCINKIGGFSCACKPGFKLNKDGRTCSDIDECLSKPCGCVKNDKVCQSTCVNTVGSYQCKCPKGYHLNSADLCEDINECFLDQTLCDHACVNTLGSYKCRCFPGFAYNDKTNKCEDLNECLVGNGGCSDNCINLNGSYVCTCPQGKYLQSDRRTCKDIDLKSKSEVFCQSGAIGMLTCEKINEKINITNVFYGRVSDKVCQHGNYRNNLNCNLPNAIDNLKDCNGMASCLVMLDLWQDPCPGVEKYAQVSYRCEK